MDKLAGLRLGGVEQRLQDGEWIACDDFTVADIMMDGVLRGIRKTNLMEPFPRLTAYFERCQARPAWQRTHEPGPSWVTGQRQLPRAASSESRPRLCENSVAKPARPT